MIEKQTTVYAIAGLLAELKSFLLTKCTSTILIDCVVGCLCNPEENWSVCVLLACRQN